MKGLRLDDIGERRIVSELLRKRYARTNPSFGDDVAPVGDFGGGRVVVTTDPAPIPVAWELGIKDYYDWGWLLATINLSDIAAAGARPLGLLTSLTLRADTLLTDFVRLLDGIDACCEAAGTYVVGGNIKESASEVCEATAIGLVDGRSSLSRSGTRVGDDILVFGSIGLFWSAILGLQRRPGLSGDDELALRNALVRPQPLVALGTRLRTSGLVNACTDASDGIYGAVSSLVARSDLGVLFEPQSVRYAPIVTRTASRLGLDPFRLALGFGNFELVASVCQENTAKVLAIAQSEGVHTTRVGTAEAHPGMRIWIGHRPRTMSSFDNERFTADSQFTAGLRGYTDRLLTTPLWVDEAGS